MLEVQCEAVLTRPALLSTGVAEHWVPKVLDSARESRCADRLDVHVDSGGIRRAPSGSLSIRLPVLFPVDAWDPVFRR